MRARVEWIPTSPDGSRWIGIRVYPQAGAKPLRLYAGRVIRLRNGGYEASVRARRYFYSADIHRAARIVVAHINNIYPSQLPR